VLEEFESGRLELPHCPDPNLPRIALMAGAPYPFRLNDKNEVLPSVDEFLQPLDLAAAITKSKLSPQFLVLTIHSTILHQKTIKRFSATIFQLLESNYSVHLRLTTLQEHGFPQEKCVLVMVAAPPSTSLPWQQNWPLPDSQPSLKVNDLIGDITFNNPRVSREMTRGFVCSIPGSDGSDILRQTGANLLYNHQTGRRSKTVKNILHMDANTVTLAPYGAMPLHHPGQFVHSSFLTSANLEIQNS
jgi:hypothetical protein